jgi:hypothetical protein
LILFSQDGFVVRTRPAKFDCLAEGVSLYRKELRQVAFEVGRKEVSVEFFAEYRQNALEVHLRKNESGLHRNACLGLAGYCIARDDWSTAYHYLLDVLFLDVCGSCNSLPGYQSFNSELSLVIPLVVWLLEGTADSLGLDRPTMKTDFAARWTRFPMLTKPKIQFRDAWKRILEARDQSNQARKPAAGCSNA